MKKYISFFKLRLSLGLQYRAAAYAGILTQFAWGGMTLLMFKAFYDNGQNAFPMTFPQLASYLWLQQSFLALFMAWYFDNDLFEMISGGNIAYELCRPFDMYTMWFIKNMAIRLSRTILRSAPILLVAVFLPAPYNISPPASVLSGSMFVISLILGFLVMIAFGMLIYIFAFYTVSNFGIRILATSVIEFFAGAVIPLPFFPGSLKTVMNILPFASMQNTPFLIYNGFIKGADIVSALLLQAGWLTFFLIVGKLMMDRALKKIVVQGG